MVWFERLVKLVEGHSGPILFIGESRWGAPYLIKRIDKQKRPLVWLGLTERDAGDEVAQGNKLVDALRRAVKVDLIGYGLPYTYSLAVLETYLDLLGPFTFALSGAEQNPDLAQRLFDLGPANAFIATFTDTSGTFQPQGSLILGPDELAMTLAEALAIADGNLTQPEVVEVLEQSGRAYETFTLALHKRLGLPVQMRPTPEGPRLPATAEVKVDAEALLTVLCNRERWPEALDLAVEALPHRISDILAEAGHYFHERGLHQRLWEVLDKVPTEATDSTVLFWKLSAATRLGRIEHLRQPVEVYLTAHPEAADLRALHAGTLAQANQYLTQARRAAEAQQNAFTLYQYGRALALEDPQAGERILRDAVDLAEQTGRPYEVIRNSWALAARLIALGRYREGVFWSRWAVEKYESSQRSGDVQLWLLSVNEWAFGRILIGEIEGLERLLLELEAHVERVSPALARLFKSTLGDYYLASGSPDRAHTYYEQNWHDAQRAQLGNDACNLVRVLLELGRYDDALHVGERAFYLTRGDKQLHVWLARLSYGMALSFLRPEEALGHLTEVWEQTQPPLSAIPLTRTALYLARTQLLLGQDREAQQVLHRVRAELEPLAPTGFMLMAGPDSAFYDVFTRSRGKQSSLELSLLGTPLAYLNGQPVNLPLRQLEVLCVLALEPNGLSGSEFVLQLYGDHGQTSNLKATISKLRRNVPIAAQPYRLLVPLQADFIEVKRLLREGQVRKAISMVRGTLLPQSEAPRIIEYREELEEAIRQAALASNDADALLALAEILRDDLEVWECALAALVASDPRFTLVQTKVHAIRKAWAIGT